MRWLLIIMLLLLQAQAPGVAAAMDGGAPALASCHGLPDDGDHRIDADHDGAEYNGAGHDGSGHADTASATHLCPGCSVPQFAPLVGPAADLPDLPLLSAIPDSMASLASEPVPPPPRAA